MKYLLLGIALVAFTSCQKVHKTGDGGSTSSQFEPTKQYDIKIIANNQQVVVDNFQKQDSVLSMTYYEKVSLVVRPADYNNAWGLYFNQSYTGTALDNVLFTTPNRDGQYTYNWIETNLNNVSLQSKTDTVINNNTYYNLKLSRVITFLQAYSAGKAAADQARNDLLQRKNDAVTFTSYYTNNGQASVANTTTAKLVYVKP